MKESKHRGPENRIAEEIERYPDRTACAVEKDAATDERGQGKAHETRYSQAGEDKA
jgi:hypothetical protein